MNDTIAMHFLYYYLSRHVYLTTDNKDTMVKIIFAGIWNIRFSVRCKTWSKLNMKYFCHAMWRKQEDESSPGDLEYARNDESACSHKLARLARALTKMQLEL